MSTAQPPFPTTTTLTTTGVGLGYSIAIAVSILVLISTIMLASYLCVRIKSHGCRDSFHLESIHQNNNISVQPDTFILGLEKPMIDAYPKMILGESRRLPKPNESPCAICLTDYLPKETIRCVPDCQHCFHAECVDEWLQMSATCPLCRNSPAPSLVTTPVVTPLSELVPLAFHAR